MMQDFATGSKIGVRNYGKHNAFKYVSLEIFHVLTLIREINEAETLTNKN